MDVVHSFAKFVFIASITASALGCKPAKEIVHVPVPAAASDTKTDKDDGGGLDGGGTTGSSTPEEVREAIEVALKWMTDKDGNRNVLVRYAMDWENKFGKWQGFANSKFFQKIHNAQSWGSLKYDTLPEFKFESAVIDSLRANKSRITLKEDGPCPASDKDHAAASVSKLDLNAELCVSISELTKTPKDTLQAQVFGLLVHEASHMVGYKENMANQWQSDFKDYYNSRLKLSSAQFEQTLLGHIFLFIAYVGRTDRALKKNNLPDAVVEATAFLGWVKELPYFLDPMALEIVTRPKKPWLFDNYSNAVLAILQLNGDIIYRSPVAGGKQEGPSLTLEILENLSKENTKLFEIALNNLQAYRGITHQKDGVETEAQTKCILPEIRKTLWRNYIIKEGVKMWPPRECSPEQGP